MSRGFESHALRHIVCCPAESAEAQSVEHLETPERMPRGSRVRPGRRTPASGGHPRVRHGRLGRSRVATGLVAGLALATAVVVASTASIAAIAVWHLTSNVQANAVEIGGADAAPVPSIGEFEGGFNIMLVGVDNDPNQSSAAYGDRDGAILNDVNILLHVSGDHTNATAVSIPRDMVVPVPACEKEDGSGESGPMTGRPINETYSLGGLKCVVDTVSQLTGLEIPFGGVITFDGVIQMSNVVGGVEVCVDGPIRDRYTGLTLPAAGTYTLSGVQAEQFVRTRHGVGDGSDLGRISSQQVFMSALVRKLINEGTLSDVVKLYGIAEAATSNMKLSTSLANLDTMVSIAQAMRGLPLANVTFVQYPGTTGGGGIYKGKVQPIQSQAKKLFQKLRNDEPFTLDENAVGSNGGSTLEPGSTPAPTESGDASAPPVDPSAAPSDGATDPAADDPNADDPNVIAGIKGQTAAQVTCSVANN